METTTLFWVLGALAAIAGGGVAWYFRNRNAAGADMRHCRCTNCGQKMRFLAARAGKTGRCPRCGKDVALIEASAPAGPHAPFVGRRLQSSSPTVNER